MDSDRFDRLAQSLSTVDTRRRLLPLLSALPLASALAVLRNEETPATGWRKKRTDRPRQNQTQRKPTSNQLEQQRKKKKRHKKRKGATQILAPGCQPASAAQTCAGLCGPVVDNCGVNVDCTAACAGCCIGTTCHIDDDNACGTGGGSCTPCTG